MRAPRFGWATQLLMWLLRDGDGPALLGDLAEGRALRAHRDGASEAGRWYRGQLYASLASVVRWRTANGVRAVPWGTAAGAYGVVALLEFGSLWLLSMTWPRVAYPTSTGRLLIECPGIVAIAYAAASVRRTAPFALGGMMLVVAILMLSLSTEAISIGYAVALLSKADVMAAVRQSFDFAEALLREFSDQQLNERVTPPPYMGSSASPWLVYASMRHTLDIYGQMVVYLRLNGIVPPASRPGGL